MPTTTLTRLEPDHVVGLSGMPRVKAPTEIHRQPCSITRPLRRALMSAWGSKAEAAAAAVMGQGIALGRLSVTRSDILAGKLVCLSEHSLRVAYCHYAVYPIASESNPALVAFRDWLVEEARRT